MTEKLGIQIQKKFRRPRIDRSSLFVFGSRQLIKAWILSWGIVFLLVGYGEPQVGDICLYYLGLGSGHPITPRSQGVQQYVGDRVLGLGYKGGGHLRIGGDDLGLGRVSVDPFVKPVQKSGGCL